MKEVKIGLIGANWMGSFHSVGLTNVRQAYHDVKPASKVSLTSISWRSRRTIS